jgi:spore maturation protein CgeB
MEMSDIAGAVGPTATQASDARRPPIRVLFLVENYHRFYDRYLERHPQLGRESYETQCRTLFDQAFYQADSYTHGWNCLGHEAAQVILDCRPLQLRWANEDDRHVMIDDDDWLEQIFVRQLKRFRPDVLYVFSGVPVSESLLAEARRHVPLLVCQWSCPILPAYPYRAYDLVVSSARNLGVAFREMGLRFQDLQQAVDERALAMFEPPANRRGAVFIGSLSPDHCERIATLDFLSRNAELDFFGAGVEFLPADSPLRNRYRGEAFGRDMYRVLSRYRIALHIPGDIGRPFAGAKRLFETTGAGAMLLTKRQVGLDESFVPGREVAAFADREDALRQLRHFLRHDREAAAIARAGRERTLASHTFSHRIRELQKILAPALAASRLHGDRATTAVTDPATSPGSPS